MALRRALEMLKAGEQINDRLHRSVVGREPERPSSRWTDGGTRRRPVTISTPRSVWPFGLGTAQAG